MSAAMKRFQVLNQAYRQLANAYMNVQFIDLYDAFLNEEGQLRPDYTTDGLHLTIAGCSPVQGFAGIFVVSSKKYSSFAGTEPFLFSYTYKSFL